GEQHHPQHREQQEEVPVFEINEGLFGTVHGIQDGAPIQSPVENQGNTIQIDPQQITQRLQGHNHHRIRNHRNNNQNPCCTIL
uniref:Uncharacterized protein n=1 Tax=Meloidogyne floridensis TaxID=298350 RepID=A0A915P4R9_9BILA